MFRRAVLPADEAAVRGLPGGRLTSSYDRAGRRTVDALAGGVTTCTYDRARQ